MNKSEKRKELETIFDNYEIDEGARAEIFVLIDEIEGRVNDACNILSDLALELY